MRLIVGTTPTLTYTFHVVAPSNIAVAILN